MGEEVGAAWESEGLLVCRPLVVCLAKEVAYYLRHEGLEVVLEIKPSTGVEPRVAGIEALTEGQHESVEEGMRTDDEEQHLYWGLKPTSLRLYLLLSGLPQSWG